jgi:hypothetical protein
LVTLSFMSVSWFSSFSLNGVQEEQLTSRWAAQSGGRAA